MKRLLSLMLILTVTTQVVAQTVQFTIKATSTNTLNVYFRPTANIGPVLSGITNLTFVLQTPQTLADPTGMWTVTSNTGLISSSYASMTATSTTNGSKYNTLFSWISAPLLIGTTFNANTEYLLATVTTPSGITIGDVAMIDWGNNRLDNATSGVPLWATSLAIDGADMTDNTSLFYGNASTNPPTNSGTTTGASTLVLNGTPLSVKLINFSGNTTENGISLNWVAANEKELHVYELEYSNNGANWERIASIMPKNSLRSSYNYLHAPEENPVHHYRLKLVGKNAGVFYSETLMFTGNSVPAEDVKLYPTLVYQGQNMSLELATGKAGMVQIVDVAGKLISQMQVEDGNNQIQTANLAKGTYYMIINADNNKSTQKFVVR